MIKRVVGGVFILFSATAAILYNYYPFTLTLDNPISFSLRKFIYVLRVIGGEDNVEVMAIAFCIVFLPLLFRKPFYYFFKNLLGVEIGLIGWLGVYGLANYHYQPHILGLIPYDVSRVLMGVVGEFVVFLLLLVSLLLGIFLVLTSYKFPSEVIGVITKGLADVLRRSYESIVSLFGYSGGGARERSNYGFSETSNYWRRVSGASGSEKPHRYTGFVEITEIEAEEEPVSGFSGDVYQGYNRAKQDLSDITVGSDRKFDFREVVVKENERVGFGESVKIKDIEVVETEVVDRSRDTEYGVEGQGNGESYHTGGKIFAGRYPPPIDLLDEPEFGKAGGLDELKEIEETKRTIQNTFAEFKIDAVIEGVVRGPVVTMYEVRPRPGTKIAKIVNISDNLALNLATSRVRIVYPIPGKSVIGIEIPNKSRRIVRIREVIESKEYRDGKEKLPLVIGVDIHGKPVVEDLTQMPHLLIAGSTGSGKSVYVNSIIVGLLYKKRPDELRLIMIDLKIVELKAYNGIPHLLSPVITTPNLAKAVLEWLVEEMNRRYKKLESLGCRDINQYNAKVSRSGDRELEKLPYIVLIIDEYADLMMTSPKETEDYITRLAAMSRAVGIHLIIATQRPSVDVVTGLIKANFPARVAFRVASKVDSRTILDAIGAEKLLGRGDLLFMSPSHPSMIRVQGCFISNEEVERVVEYLMNQDYPNYIDLSSLLESGGDDRTEEAFFEDEGEEFSDELYNEAVKIVVTEKKASASYLQRRLRIGYNRAARMIERMEEEGIVGPQQGSKPREILVTESYLEKLKQRGQKDL